MGSESKSTVVKAEYAIGIDLGTTYSSVGIWRSGRVEIIADPSSTSKLIPSYVAFSEEYDEEKMEYKIEKIVGESALNTDNFRTTKTIFDSKRMIGRKFSDETVQKDINSKSWPFNVVRGSDGKPMISVNFEGMGETKEYAPEDISAEVLKKLKAIVEDYLSTDTRKVVVEDAVITVPANFNQSQRQATRDAGRKAGLKVLRLINEPTAAAVAYTHDRNGVDGKKNVVVFDLGGGTFDVSCLTVTNNNIVIKAVGGDSHLGGQDFVQRMVDHFVEVFEKKYVDKNIRGDIAAMRKLRKECERCKKSLSGLNCKKTKTSIESLAGVEYFHEEITRAKFEELNMDLFNKCIEIVKKCLEDAKMNKDDVDNIVLVGGSSRIPKVRQMLREFMNDKDLYVSIDATEAVVTGAAIQAALLSGRGSESIEKLKLVDVTPLSLGTDTVGDVMSVLIPKNTPIPFRAVQGFTTVRDHQTTITTRVYEGERARASANKLLGEVELTGIKPDLRGVASVQVCYDLQEDGILEVSAKDRATGKEISTTIQDVKLSCEEVQRMVKEAKENEDSDEMLKKKKEARDSFVSYICKLRNEIKSMKADERKEAAIEEAFKWVDSTKQLAEVSEYEEKKKKLMCVMDA